MDMKWNYKIDLKDSRVFAKIERERGIILPKELIALVEDGNAATPEKYKFVIGSTEKVLGAILSFNEEETDTDTVFTALEVIPDTKLFPFAIDPFGNYICLDLRNNEVVFWDHENETNNVFPTGKGLKEFLEGLY